MLSDPRLTIARRELRSLSAEKTIVLAILIQVFIAAFSSFLVVGLVSLTDPSAGGDLDVGVTGPRTAPITDAAGGVGVDVRTYNTTPEALGAFDAGEVDAVLATDTGDGGRIAVQVVVPDGSVRTARIVSRVKVLLEDVERDRRTELARTTEALNREPLPLPERGVGSPFFTFTYTLLVPLLLFLPVFISGSIGVDAIAEELDRGTLDLLRVTPATTADIITGKLLTAVGIAPLQAVVWMGLLAANGTPVRNAGVLLAVVTGLAATLVAVAVGLALALPDRRQAQFAYSVAVLAGFGFATLWLPQPPVNTFARLAVGSADSVTFAAAGAYVLLGAVGLLGVRRAAAHLDER